MLEENLKRSGKRFEAERLLDCRQYCQNYLASCWKKDSVKNITAQRRYGNAPQIPWSNLLQRTAMQNICATFRPGTGCVKEASTSDTLSMTHGASCLYFCSQSYLLLYDGLSTFWCMSFHWEKKLRNTDTASFSEQDSKILSY